MGFVILTTIYIALRLLFTYPALPYLFQKYPIPNFASLERQRRFTSHRHNATQDPTSR